MATNLLLSTFSIIVEKAATISQKVKNSPVLMVEMANSFQIIIRGFAREGINHSYLDILNA
jgi:O-glycosyl hydrolase